MSHQPQGLGVSCIIEDLGVHRANRYNLVTATIGHFRFWPLQKTSEEPMQGPLDRARPHCRSGLVHMITTVAIDFLHSSNWAGAFSSLGLFGDRAYISGTLQSHCPGVAISDSSDIRIPTVEDLKHVLPNRLNIPRLHNLLMARPRCRRLITL